MTRKNRKLIISTAVLAALILVVVVTRRTGNEDDAAVRENTALVDMVPGEIRLLDTENSGGGITLLSMDGESWLAEDVPDGFQLKDTVLESMVNNLSNLNGRLIEDSAEDLTAYGLASPLARVRMVSRDSTEVMVFFGHENPSGNSRYATILGKNAVYLVPSFQASNAFLSLSDLREDRLGEIAMDQLASLVIQSGGSRFRAEPAAGERNPFQTASVGMEVTEPWSTPRPVENHSLQERLTTAPPPSRIAAFLAQEPGSPKEVGLGAGADRIRLETTNGAVYDLEIGKTTGDGYRYGREMSNPDLIFLLDEDDLELLNTRPFELTGKFVFLAEIGRVDEVEIQKGGEGYTLSIDRGDAPEDDSDDRYFVNGREIPEPSFKKAYQAVIGLLYEGVAKNPPGDGFPEAVIRFDHIDPAVEDASIAFIPYDTVYYSTSVTGEKSDFLIGRYQLDAVMESIKSLVSGIEAEQSQATD